MAKILKNQTVSDIEISDTGISVPGSGQYTIQQQDYPLWASSDDIVTEVGNGNLIVNDGSYDLGISDSMDLIKGLFPSTVTVTGVGGSNELETKPSLGHQVNYNKMVSLLDEIVRQMRILNTHMGCVTDLEDLEEEPGDHPIV